MKPVVFAYLLFVQLSRLWAQRPTHVPRDSGPVDFFETTADFVVYIVIPVIVIILYFIWRNRVRKEKTSKQPPTNTNSETEKQ